MIISTDLLAAEIQLVKRVDPARKIIVNLWGNDLTHRNCLPQATTLADIIGLDIYYKQFLTKKLHVVLHRGPRDTDITISRCMQATSKPFWITELQAEPWEASDRDYRSQQPKSMNPARLKEHFTRAALLKPEVILFWGAEYWLWKKAQGDAGMWNTARDIFHTI
jgi:hypothetical protein